MLTMSQQSTIWELWQNGKNKSEISDVLHIDRKTVTKYLEKSCSLAFDGDDDIRRVYLFLEELLHRLS